MRYYCMSSSLFSRPDTIRNFVFGIEDSLVSTIGFVSGIAAAGLSRHSILMTGAILILVEACSMAIGALMSENSAEEATQQKEVSYMAATWGALVMFVSYVIAGSLVIAPYIFVPIADAFGVAIGISLVALFFLGMLSGHVAGISRIRKGFSTVLLGSVAIVIGVGIGMLVR